MLISLYHLSKVVSSTRVIRIFIQINFVKNKYPCLGATTFSIAALIIMTFSIMPLSLKGSYVTLSINNSQHNNQDKLITTLPL